MTQRNNLGLRLMLLLRGLSLPSVEREEGQTLAEYALILALIAAVVVAVVALLGSNISSLFSSIAGKV